MWQREHAVLSKVWKGEKDVREVREGRKKQKRHHNVVAYIVSLYLTCSYMSSLFQLTLSSDKKGRGH